MKSKGVFFTGAISPVGMPFADGVGKVLKQMSTYAKYMHCEVETKAR